MKRLFTLTCLFCYAFAVHAQKAEDIFRGTDIKYYWLGLDFSHVKLIGDFSQFANAGEKSPSEIKYKYFPAWNDLILDERDKYDVKGMLRKDYITYDIDMINELNSKTATEELEAYNPIEYTKADIQKFVKVYNPTSKEGIGLAFVVETLNKAETRAILHFVAIDLSTNTVLIHDRLEGKPSGIGLRNYWAGAIYDIIKDIKNNRYREWKNQYSK